MMPIGRAEKEYDTFKDLLTTDPMQATTPPPPPPEGEPSSSRAWKQVIIQSTSRYHHHGEEQGLWDLAYYKKEVREPGETRGVTSALVNITIIITQCVLTIINPVYTPRCWMTY